MPKQKFPKTSPISLSLQKECIEQKYPKLIEHISIQRSELSCIIYIQPSAHSEKYKIRISYKLKSRPKAWLIFPPAEKCNGKLPHHQYGLSPEGYLELCVFYPGYNEWNPAHMFLADSFIPWIATWLITYETWLLSGVWCYPESPRAIKDNEK